LTSGTARTGGVLSIDLKALQQNYLTVKSRVEPAECGASVKADAYGIGLEPAAKALWAAGCRTFFVALPEEGRKLRGILEHANIYVLGGLFSGEAAFYTEHSLRPALGEASEVEEWARWCREQGKRYPAAVHIESGINRLGLEAPKLKELAGAPEIFSLFDLTLVLSHLARADEPEDDFNRQQLERFEALRRLLPRAPASLANSPGAFLPRTYHFDLVRPGIALYGGNPFHDRPNPFKPVALLAGRILQLKRLKEGDSVGYGGNFRAARASLIGVVAAGYADGYPRACSFQAGRAPALVWAKGHFAPVVGRVSMDMMTVDMTDIPVQLKRGDMVELMGTHVTVDDLASWAGTLPYEILTRLGSRYARLYSDFDS
jgi:alanine racemase